MLNTLTIKPLVALVSVALLGTAQISSAQDDEDLLTLIQLMETDIAVKTEKLDQDKSPGLVTVLRGDDLEARGIQNVQEALTLVPGFDVTADNLGLVNPAVRGVGGILASASGKVKYLINGVSATQSVSANGSLVFKIPVMQIERIEVIRGPGAAIYGEYAFSGVVNVVTRENDKRLGLSLGSFDSFGGVGSYSQTTDSGWHMSGSVAYSESEGDDTKAGPDILGTTSTPNRYEEQKDVLLSLSKDRFKASLIYSDTGSGDYYGLGNTMPPPDNREVRGSDWLSLDVENGWELSEQLVLNARAGYKQYSLEFDEAVVNPPGFTLNIPAFPPFVPEPISIVYPNGMIASTYYEEDRVELGAEAVWTGWENQTWLLGAEYTEIENHDSYAINNFSPIGLPLPLPGFVRFPGDVATLPDGYKRKIKSLYVQDQITVSDQFNITAGFRYDDYNDVGDEITPRIAMVYQPAANHIFKAQYAEAFRPPTLTELTSVVTGRLGNPDMEPEKSTTYELAYIYKTQGTVFRATAFYSDLDDLITIPAGTYQNIEGAEIQGLELELEHQFSPEFKLDGNVSLTDTEDKLTNKDLLGASDWMANLSLLYQPSLDASYVARFRYVDDRYRSPTDTRSAADSYSTVDVTGSWFNVLSPGLTIRAGVRNLFDEEYVDLAPERTYVNDYPQEGRNYWLQLTKDF